MSGSVVEEISLKLYYYEVFSCKFWHVLVPQLSLGSLKVFIVELTGFLCSELSLSSVIAFLPAKVHRC